jgi:hypothetical protein
VRNVQILFTKDYRELKEDVVGRSCSIIGRLKGGAHFGDVGVCVRIALDVVSKKECDSVEWCAL